MKKKPTIQELEAIIDSSGEFSEQTINPDGSVTVIDYKAEYERLTAEVSRQWQPIETAPKGGGASRVDDPSWIDPPRILLYFPAENQIEVGYWDWYYAPTGHGHENCSAWVIGEYAPAAEALGEPTHWMPLPSAPASSQQGPK